MTKYDIYVEHVTNMEEITWVLSYVRMRAYLMLTRIHKEITKKSEIKEKSAYGLIGS